MARIVLGIGTSHGPMLSTPPEKWDARVPDDRRNRHHYQGKTYTFDELLRLREHEHLPAQITEDTWRQRYDACHAAGHKLTRLFEEVKPDVAVIFGNDQMEVFTPRTVPAFTVFLGEMVENIPMTEEQLAQLPAGIAIAEPGHMTPERTAYPTLPALGMHITRSLIGDEFDVAVSSELPAGPLGSNSVPHAFGYVYRNLMSDRVIPHVPLLLNTFYPPNQPTARRCLDFGQAVAKAVQSWDSDSTVALIASGGLSHFVIDEDLDRTIIEGMRDRDTAKLTSLPENLFQAGSSEIKNWIPVAGAMVEIGFAMHLVDYVPCYRSEAGTGNAMAFAYWR